MTTGGTPPPVSVVVATCGRPHLLAALLDALAPDPAVAEVVVVVDGGDEASLATLEALTGHHPVLSVLASEKAGQLGALARGVEQASGEVVLLLDDDVLPGPLLATGHAAHHHRSPGLVVVGAMPVRLAGGRDDPVGTRLYAEEYLAHCHRLTGSDRAVLEHLWLGNVSLRRADGRRVGLTSPAPGLVLGTEPYHADQELGYRLADAGLVGVFDPALWAEHLHRRDAQGFLRDAERQGAGRVRLERLRPDRANPEPPGGHSPTQRLAATALAALGTTAAARPLARGLMAAGDLAGRLGRDRFEVHTARTARRLMAARGARREAARSDGAAPGRPRDQRVPSPRH